MLWHRIRKALSPKSEREFTVKKLQVEKTVQSAKRSERNVLNQLTQLNMVLRHERE